jgi:hypothetical protein
MKTEAQRKKEAKARARALQKTKERLGLGTPGPLKGAVTSPLVASTKVRDTKPVATSDRIPGSAPAKDLLHAHKRKRGAEETELTTREMRRKAKQIAPAYNKGPLQYLPHRPGDDCWPERDRDQDQLGEWWRKRRSR